MTFFALGVPGSANEIRERAQELGFEEDDVTQAIASTGSAATLETVLDWLCVHVAEDALPSAFGNGATCYAPHPYLSPSLSPSLSLSPMCVCVRLVCVSVGGLFVWKSVVVSMCE